MPARIASPTSTSPASSTVSQTIIVLASCQALRRSFSSRPASDRQVAGRQGAFAEELAEEIGDAIGDDKGVGTTPLQAKQGRRGHVADQSQHAAGQGPQAGNQGAGDQGVWLRGAHKGSW